MDLGIAGRVAIVTGSSRGIGRACAEALLREGAHVVVTGRDRGRLDAACEALAALGGGKVLGLPTDFADDGQTRAMVERTLQEFGRLDILVNSASTLGAGDFLSFNEARWLGIFEEKLNGYARALRHAIAPMREGGWGRIVNISGAAGRQPAANTISVGVNNIAVLSLTKALANWLVKDGILVNAVVPHIIDTDTQAEIMRKWSRISGKPEDEVRQERIGRIPLGRMGRPEEVADAVAFLASERAGFITGTTLTVDGGVTATI